MCSVLERMRPLRPADGVAEEPSHPAENEVQRNEKDGRPGRHERGCSGRQHPVTAARARDTADPLAREGDEYDQDERNADDRESAERVRIDDEAGRYEAEQE